MKILIVDDDKLTAKRIRSMLSASSDLTFLVVSDSEFAHQLADFGIAVDVALVDLRLAPATANYDMDYDGLAVCQKVRQAMPNSVIVGYSSSFTLESQESQRLKEKFKEMGADIVCALDHLTLTPASELRYEFEEARKRRNLKGPVVAKPKLFIGSSTEGLEVANRIQAGLPSDIQAEVWDQTAFGLGEVTLESLEKAIREFQFAVFVFSPDDEIQSRGERKIVARDNVIFEAGLFIGSLGRSRAFVVKQKGNAVTLPSDLSGLTVATYDPMNSNLRAALGPVCQKIKDAVTNVLESDPLQ